MKKLKFLFDYFKYLKNPFTALAFKFGLKKNCDVKIKNYDDELTITSIDLLNRFMRVLPMVKKDRYANFIKYFKNIEDDDEFVIINNIKYYNINNAHFKKEHTYNYHDGNVILEEYFYANDWNPINFQDRFVIDIGANVADRTLYFAKCGAKSVIGFEPVKHVYELGLENISANPSLKDNITLINKAVGGKKGKLVIDNLDSAKNFATQSDSYEIDVITLTDVLSDYNFTPDVLKMDCEGCEFEIILNEDLSMFNDIIFEHHSYIVGKDYHLLIDKLKKENFKINVFTSDYDNFDDVGIIHAYK